METASIEIIAVSAFISMLISGLFSHIGRSEEREEVKKIREWRKSLVTCEVTGCLVEKYNAYVVTIQGKKFVGRYMYHDGKKYKYYSPKFAPKYDHIDQTVTPHKYYRTIKEHKVEMK